MRFDNVLAQDYFVQLIEEGTDGNIKVSEMEIDDSRSGEILLQGFGSRLKEAVIIVSPVTKDTSHPSQYTLTITPP